MADPVVAEAASSGPAAPADLPARRPDWLPLLLVPVLALLALPVVGDPGTWLTLTIVGLAMGVILFTVSSGLMLVFGLMDVMVPAGTTCLSQVCLPVSAMPG